MRRRITFLVLFVFLTVTFSTAVFTGAARRQAPQPQAGSQPAPTAVAPNDSGSVASQTGEAAAARRELQCRGCHATGRPLPYLAGSLFHADEHAAYSDGFHAKAVKGGHRAATCIDCHTKGGGGDMTTLLPKADPGLMRGSGITVRPFLSYRESVHAEAASRGNLGAAVCTDCHGLHDILPSSDARSLIAPANLAFYDGRVSEELYKEEHELDYERMRREEAEAAAASARESEGPEDRPGMEGGIDPKPLEQGGH